LQEARKSQIPDGNGSADTKTVREYTTTYCAVKTILIPYLVIFGGGFTKKSPPQGHEITVKKNEVLKPRSACGYHGK
jgi:hypothetical protein